MFTENKEGEKKLREIVEAVKTCMFTTINNDHPVFSRPIHTIKVDKELNLWFFVNNEFEKIKTAGAESKATLVYAHPGQSTYMNIYGSVEMHNNKEKMKELWIPTLKSWFPQGIEDPSIYLLQVIVDEAEYWNNSSNGMEQIIRQVA